MSESRKVDSKKFNVILPVEVYLVFARWAQQQARAVANLAAFITEREAKEAIQRGDNRELYHMDLSQYQTFAQLVVDQLEVLRLDGRLLIDRLQQIIKWEVPTVEEKL
jgi:CopG-like RHH_1 or ribbon-helix-helix domain, RHH_5